jgi:hypothetical protein
MEELKDELNLNIVCGKCGERAKLVRVEPSRPITDWDKTNNFNRKTEYFCCKKFWFINLNNETMGFEG